jgi:hypothetical protein
LTFRFQHSKLERARGLSGDAGRAAQDGGYEVRIEAEPVRAGQIALRHGSFASTEEAASAGRDIARLEVPNEVVLLR